MSTINDFMQAATIVATDNVALGQPAGTRRGTIQQLADAISLLIAADLTPAAGANGTGIASAAINGSGHLILTKTDSTVVDAGYVRGVTGPAGLGIANMTVNSSGHLIVTFTDTGVADAGIVAGAAGPQGPAGAQGAQGPQGPAGATGAAGAVINSGTVSAAGALSLIRSDGATISVAGTIGVGSGVYLPLAGGAVTGAVAVAADASHAAFSAGASGISITSTLAGETTTGAAPGLTVNATVSGAPLTDSFPVQVNLTSSAATGAGATGGQSQHTGITSGFTRNNPAPGQTQFSSARPGAQGWNLWLPTSDNTGLPSSAAGALTGIEFDASASGRDDASNRYGIQFTLSANAASPDHTCEYARFLYVNGHNEGGNITWFQSVLQLYAPYTVAAIDLSSGTQDRADPTTGVNKAVAIKLRSGMKYGLNGDGQTGQYLTHNGTAAQTEIWSGGQMVLAVTDAGAIVAPHLPTSASGLPSGALWSNAGVVTRVA